MLWLARTQAAAGHQVRLYSRGDRDDSREIDGFTLVSAAFPFPDNRLGFAAEMLMAHRAGRDMRAFRPDVVHSHSVPEAALLAPRGAARFISYDHFQFRRGTRTPYYYLTRRLLSKFDRLLPVSGAIAEESVKYWNLPQAPVEVVPNGVDTGLFRPAPASGDALRRSLGIAPGEIVLLWAGRVNYVKGIDILCEAFLAARLQVPSLRLVVVGPPDAFGKEGSNEFVDMIRRAGGIYRPAVGEGQLPAFFNLCDISIYASRNEPFGMAVVEAQACGKPVIASDVGGLPEVMGDGGLLFHSGNPRHLSERIVELALDEELRRRLSERALRNAARFDWRQICRKLDRVYAQSR
jgi:glycosyltransferase involved in cell wall biosynthesis